MGTNGTRAFVASNRWSIRQLPTVREFGVSLDPDDVQGDFGGFFVDEPMPAEVAAPAPASVASALPPAPSIASPAQAASSVMPDLEAAQTELKAKGMYDGLIDGLWGARTEAAFAAWYGADHA
jgi:hypothetical protein